MDETVTYQVFARKWRPKTFAMLQGQEHVTRALTNALKHNQLHHAYLFTGTRGVGKTTLARIFAKALNCEQGVVAEPCGQCSVCTQIDEGRFVDLIEVDAASRTKVEDTRELLENVQYGPSVGRYKIYLIDEVHMLSGHSFNALLKTLEEPPAHVKFILATTDPQRIPVTVLSRCLTLNLRPLSSDEIVAQCEWILKTESIPYDKEACDEIAEAAQGSMRDALSLLEQAVAYGNRTLHTQEVATMLGLGFKTLIPELWQAINDKNAQEGLQITAKMAKMGADFSKVLKELLQILHTVALSLSVPHASSRLADYGRCSVEFLSSVNMTAEEVQMLYQMALFAQRDMAYVPDQRIGFEMLFLRMIVFRPQLSESISARIVQPHENVPSPKENKPLASPSPTTALPKEAPKKTHSDLDWQKIANALPLHGVSRVLVKHCVLKNWDGARLTLMLDETQKACYSDSRLMQIQTAVSDYFKKPVNVKILMGALRNETTPLQQEEENKIKKRQQAQSSIQNDSNAQKIIETFNAKIENITVIE